MKKDIDAARNKKHFVTLDNLVAKDHLVRELHDTLDFTYVKTEMQKHFDDKVQPEIDPVTIMKHMLFCFLNGIETDSPLEEDLSSNITYRWFLEYDILEPMPTAAAMKHICQDFGGDSVWDVLLEQALRQCKDNGLPCERNSSWLYNAK